MTSADFDELLRAAYSALLSWRDEEWVKDEVRARYLPDNADSATQLHGFITLFLTAPQFVFYLFDLSKSDLGICIIQKPRFSGDKDIILIARWVMFSYLRKRYLEDFSAGVRGILRRRNGSVGSIR